MNLSLRFRDYYNKGFLTRSNNSYIYNALLSHGYSAFSLTIYENIDIQYLPKDEARKLILEREQLYIDTLIPNYNLLKTAGSWLGFKHSEGTKALLSEINKGENHPMFGRSHTEETKALMKANHSRGMLGRTHSPDTKALISQTELNYPGGFLGKSHSAKSRAKISLANLGENNPMFGEFHTAQTLVKMSIAKGTAIYVYDTQGTLVNSFSSARKAAIFFDSNFNTILKYARDGNIFKDKWKLSTSLITKD